MMNFLSKIIVVLFLVVLLATPAMATNGDNLIGVGPISRAMGGVGIAAPQDAISAVFSNPAAMCFGPYCPTSQVDFAGTLFMPDVKAKVTGAAVGGYNKASSDDEVYAIPAFGVTVPIGDGLKPPNWRFGLAAYGVTGLGVDYRETDIDRANAGFGGNPLIAGTFTALQSMRFAPSVAYQPNAKLSFGLAGVVEYSNLDLGEGADWDYGFGLQGGTIYKATSNLSLGLNIITPTFSMSLGYMHAFENSLSETGTDVTGTPVEIESELTENAIDFGLTWRF